MRIRLRLTRELSLLLILVASIVVMSFASDSFFTAQNLLDDMPRHLVEKGIIACGMTFIIMTGGIDLSVGSLLGLSGIVLGYGWQVWGWGVYWAIPAALMVGILGGAFNGWLVTRWSFPPLVVTLGTMAFFRGLAMIISKARPVSEFPASFAWLGQGYIGPLPAQVVCWVIIVVLSGLAMSRTPLGRYAAAIGDSERAATFAAVRVKRVKFWLYTLTGLLTAFAAIIYVSRVSTAKADAGMGIELEAIVAVVLGGTSITGGKGSITGTFLGVLILGVIRNGLRLAGVPTVWQEIFVGIILIGTTIMNQRLTEFRRLKPKHETEVKQCLTN